MTATTQALRVATALRSLGLKQRGPDRSFSVRTETERIRDRATGIRYSQYGAAHGSVYGSAAMALVWERRFDLAEMGVRVLGIEFSDGRISPIVFSDRPGEVVLKHYDGEWETQTRPQKEES